MMKPGQRLLVTKQITTQAFCFDAPHMKPKSVKCVIPKGSVLLVTDDHEENTTAFGCKPEAYHQLEQQLIPEIVRQQPEYQGYWLILPKDYIGTKLQLEK